MAVQPIPKNTVSVKGGKQKKLGRVGEYFKRKGLTARHLPMAIVVHEMMGIFMLALTWSACYYFPPSQIPILAKPIASIKQLVPAQLTNSWNSNGFLTSKFGSSYVESSCVRKLIRPATLPLKLMLTYELVKKLPVADINFTYVGDGIATGIKSLTTIPTKIVPVTTAIYPTQDTKRNSATSTANLDNTGSGEISRKSGSALHTPTLNTIFGRSSKRTTLTRMRPSLTATYI